MADISNVNVHEIKDLYERLEGLSCESCHFLSRRHYQSDSISARIMTRLLY